jgi:hypothetical protein
LFTIIIVSAFAALAASGFTAAYLTARHAGASTLHLHKETVLQQEKTRLVRLNAKLSEELTAERERVKQANATVAYWFDSYTKEKNARSAWRTNALSEAGKRLDERALGKRLAKRAARKQAKTGKQAWKRPPRQSATSKSK